MESTKKKKSLLHIVMFPWLAHGHIMPFFELSKLLAQKGHKISFISTPKNLNHLSNSIPQNLSNIITLVSLPLPQVDGLPRGTESTSELPIHKVPFLKKAYDRLQLGLTQFLKDSDDVSWIVHDMISHWVPRLASPLGVHSVFFYISSATSMAFFGSPAEMLDGCRRQPEDFIVAPPWMDIPGGAAIAYKLHELASHWECMDPETNDIQRIAEAVRDCQLVIIRTCPEFESDSLSLLRALYEKPVLPIGLLPPSGEDQGAQLEDSKWESLSRWLDGKEKSSVVYIAFGTELSLSQELMHELGHGIEKSGLPFIWVVNDRPLVEGNLGSGIIPPGFKSRVAGRGLVWMGWVPQLRVLAHPSIGGFLTHCGWSSTIEALGLGLPLILFPGGSADLGLLARLMGGRGIGLEIHRDDKSGLFTSDLVAESMRRVMIDREGERIREKAKSMKDIFGSVELQIKCLNEFVEFLVTTNSMSL